MPDCDLLLESIHILLLLWPLASNIFEVICKVKV